MVNTFVLSLLKNVSHPHFSNIFLFLVAFADGYYVYYVLIINTPV